MASIVSFYDTGDTAKAIRSGVHQFGDLEGYMSQVEQMLAARDFFKAEKPDSLEHHNAADIAGVGVEKLTELFKNRCRTVSQPYTEEEMAMLRDTSLPETRIDERAASQFPEDLRSLFTRISVWLLDVAGDENGSIGYGKIRGNIVDKSLACYRARTSSAPATAALNAKVAKLKRNEDKRKSSKKSFLKVSPGAAKDPTRQLAKSSTTEEDTVSLDGLSVPNLTTQESTRRRTMSVLHIVQNMDDVVAFYCLFCQTYVQVLRVEKMLIRDLIPEAHQKIAFEKLLMSSLDIIVSDGEMITNQVRSDLAENNFISLIPTFRCSKLFFDMSPQFVSLFKGLKSDPATRIVNLRNSFQSTLYEGLGQLMEHVSSINTEKQSSVTANLPSDGTVHESTSSTIQILLQMAEYEDLLGRVLVKFEPNQHMNTSSPIKSACSDYFKRILRGLNLSVEQKARCYEQESLRAIFKLNNYAYMRKHSAPATSIFKIVTEVWPEVQEEYSNVITQQLSCYRHGLNKLIALLSDLSLVEKPQSDASKSAKAAIKDKFKAINTELEDLQRSQQHYAVPDETLKAQIIDSNISMVLPKYETFIDSHSVVNTFKTPEKYLKYSSSECERLLRSFFDQSA
ncbi:exocyst complex component 7-like [Sycon ciliatum]|uniref:exocyst complex component 7-like n=1 Tax=Sycon ciliatum TaxID=27933 RepID=UPI0031F6A5BE